MDIKLLIDAKKNTSFIFKQEDNKTVFNAYLKNKKILSTSIDGIKLELIFLNFVAKHKKLKNKQFSILVKQFGSDYELDFLYKILPQNSDKEMSNPKILGNIYNLSSLNETFDLIYYKSNNSKYFYLYIFNINNFTETFYKGMKYEYC